MKRPTRSVERTPDFAAHLQIALGAEQELAMAYSVLAYLIVLALVAPFVLSTAHSARARLLVAGAYGLTLFAGYLLPRVALASFLGQVALGIALIFVYRWEHPTDPAL